MPDAEREQRLLALLDQEYARNCMQQLVDLGPHKIAGTDREHAAASWIEQEMRRLGLEEVRSEPFPVAVRDLAGGATVEVLGLAGKVFDGYPMAGSWPTPADGVEGEVVYVGEGVADDYAAELDVRGKIALRVRHNAATAGDDGFLRTMPVIEAWARGAIGVIVFDELAPPDAVRIQNYLLGSHDSEVRIPIVSLAARDAQVLLARLGEGPISVRLRSTIEQREGVSHNVVGMVRGSRDPDEYVIVASHYDTWHDGAADSLSGIGALLGMARAFAESDARPDRSVVFVAHGAEEQGAPQWLDRLVGSSAFINLEHPDWVGRTLAMLNIDVIASDPRQAYVECAPELLDFMRSVASEVGIGIQPYTQAPAGVLTYVDAATYLLAGVPSANVTFWSADFWRYYHTHYDTVAMVSGEALGWTMRLWSLAAARLAELDMRAVRVDAALDHAARAAVVAAVDTVESRAPSGPAREAAEQLRAAATTAEVVQLLMQHLSQHTSPGAELAQREARRALLWCLARLSRETRVMGGPLGFHMYEAVSLYATEAAHLRHAVRHLQRGGHAVEVLERTATMRGPGRYLSPDAYAMFLRLVSEGGDWAPNMQRYVDVYPECRALRDGASPTEVLARLRPKLARAQAEADAAASRAQRVAEQCGERLRTAADHLAAALR